MIAVDVSGVKIIAVVGTWEHVLKSVLPSLASWARHYREIPSERKRGYLRRFPVRYQKLLPYLAVSRVCLTLDCVTRLTRNLGIEKAIIDDSLIPRLSLSIDAIPESRAVKSKHYRILITLADNLANYARVVMKKNPAKALQVIRRLEK